MTDTVLEQIESDVYDWLIGLEDHMTPKFPTQQEDIKYAKRLLEDLEKWQVRFERFNSGE